MSTSDDHVARNRAYWATLASQVIRFAAFRRDADDRAWLAALRLHEGSTGEAAELLAAIPADHVSGAVQQARIRLALARSELEPALALSRALVAQLDPGHDLDTGGVVYLSEQLRATPVDEGPAWELVSTATALGVPDGALFAVLAHARGTGFAQVADWAERARASSLAPGSHPLCWAWLEASSPGGSRDRAASLLESAQPASEIDRVVRHIARQELAAGSTRAGSRDQLEQTVRVLSPMPLERLPLWLRTFLLETTWRLEQVGRHFRLPEARELHGLRRRLLTIGATDAEAALDDFDTVERARIVAGRTAMDAMFGDGYPWW